MNKIHTFSILILPIAVFVYFNAQTGTNKHPFTGLHAVELIKINDYPQETHEIITEDGYILTLYRIPYSGSKINKTKPPVLLVPGLFNSADIFLHMGSDHSLAFLLSNEGYDVWLLNVRGTSWSRKHILLNPDKDTEFWDFSFQEIGRYDIINSIDYILEKSSNSKVHLIGFSQGTVSIFAALSEKPEYNNKVITYSAITPIIYFKEIPGLIPRMLLYLGSSNFKMVTKLFGYCEIFGNKSYETKILKTICHKNSILVYLCYLVQAITTGYSDMFNNSKLEVIYSNMPAGASVKQISHLIMIGEYDEFIKYDYGEDKNLLIYGQTTPPVYNLSAITAPIFAYYGDKDLCLSIRDAYKGINSLTNCILAQRLENFTHLDFLYADDVADLLYKPLITNMNKFN